MKNYKEPFVVANSRITNVQMQSALNNASTKFTSSLENLEILEKKFKNLDITMTRLLKTQTSDIEKLRKAISENLEVVKAVDDKLGGKIKTISDILTGDYIVGSETGKSSSSGSPASSGSSASASSPSSRTTP